LAFLGALVALQLADDDHDRAERDPVRASTRSERSAP
jgi:hypothetical protein